MERSIWIGLALSTFIVAVAFAMRARRAKRPPSRLGATLAPSTDWREQISPDEAERFERYANEYVTMQKRHLAKEGPGRAVHRKQVLGLVAEIEILPNLPEIAKHGLFRNAARYPALVRLSNGAADKKRNRAPDLRGFAIHITGVSGKGAIEESDTDSQDFVLLNHAWLPFANVDDFVQFGVKADAGPAALIAYLLKRYGVLGLPGLMGDLIGLLTKPFKSFAHETFNSVAPLACGPYAVRVQIVPSADNGEAPPKRKDWADALRERLERAPLAWDLQLQFYSNEASTPIENMSVDWPTPYVTVARLTAPLQNAGDPGLAARIEAMTFDTWRHALAEHRPLGNVMRARRVAYVANAKARGARIENGVARTHQGRIETHVETA